MADESSPIPVIDISAYLTGSPAERDAVARRVDETNRRLGFLLVSGHGVPRERKRRPRRRRRRCAGVGGVADAYLAGRGVRPVISASAEDLTR